MYGFSIFVHIQVKYTRKLQVITIDICKLKYDEDDDPKHVVVTLSNRRIISES